MPERGPSALTWGKGLPAFLICVLLCSPFFFPPRVSESSALYFLEGQLVQLVDYAYTVNATRRADGTAAINMLLLPSVEEQGFRQEILSQSVTETPDASYKRQHDAYQGSPCQYTEIGWQSAPQTVVAKRVARIRHTVDYGFLNTSSPFPVNPLLFSQDISPYLRSGGFIQADDPEIVGLARSLTKGSPCQIDAVVRVLNWVRSNIQYGCPTTGSLPADARGTLDGKMGNCVNFANLAVALLRAVGIPSIYSCGFVADRHQSSTGHAWVAVLYPPNGWVEYESSYWMPTGGLVPVTFLMPQHVTVCAPPLSEFGLSPCPSFSELHEANWTTISLPKRAQRVRLEAFHGEFISVPLVAESRDSKLLALNWTDLPSGWEVSSSLKILNFSNSETETFLLTIATPKTGNLSARISIGLFTLAGTRLGEVVIEIDSSPTIEGVLPSPGSIVGVRPRIEANYSSERSRLDVGKTRIVLDGQDFTASSTVTDRGVVLVPSAGLGDGIHNVVVEVWDKLGNRKSKEWSFTVDAKPPAMDVVSPRAGSTLKESMPKIEVDLSDAGSGIDPATLRMFLDGATVQASITGGSVSYTASGLKDGTHTVRVEIRDKVGNLGTKEWSFEVSTALLDTATALVATAIVAVLVVCVFLLKRGRPTAALPLPPPPP